MTRGENKEGEDKLGMKGGEIGGKRDGWRKRRGKGGGGMETNWETRDEL